MKIRRPQVVAAALTIALLVTASGAGASEPGERHEPLTLVASVSAGQLAGITTTDAIWRAVRLYENVLPAAIGGLSGPSLAGVAARLTVVALVDAPLGEVVGSIQHEVFGHGARARELGLTADSSLVLPRPYAWMVSGQGGGAGTSVREVGSLSPSLRAAVHGAGIEANHAHSNLLARRAFATGTWNGRGDAIVYLGSRLVYAPSFFFEKGIGGGVDTANADDVRKYLGALAQDARARRSSFDAATQLRIAYLWTFVDPLLVSATVAALRFIVTGENRSEVGGIPLGRTTFLPRPSFGLTPFGPERGLGVWLRTPSSVLELGLAMTSFGGIDTGRLAARYERRWGAFTWAAAAQGWSQPALRRDQGHALGEAQFGGMIAATIAWDSDALPLGVVAHVGGKTAGFSEALPLDGGPYAVFGVRVRLP